MVENSYLDERFSEDDSKGKMDINLMYAHIRILLGKINIERSKNSQAIQKYRNSTNNYDRLVEKSIVEDILKTGENLFDYISELIKILNDLGINDIEGFLDNKEEEKEKIPVDNKTNLYWNDLSEEEKDNIGNNIISDLRGFESNFKIMGMQKGQKYAMLKLKYSGFPDRINSVEEYYNGLRDNKRTFDELDEKTKNDLIFLLEKKRDWKDAHTIRRYFAGEIYRPFRLKIPDDFVEKYKDKYLKELMDKYGEEDLKIGEA